MAGELSDDVLGDDEVKPRHMPHDALEVHPRVAEKHVRRVAQIDGIVELTGGVEQ
eukprot:CAMPEP_0198214562 /NCGR_PEP_ID=MMETSP1445-20131203/42413_1 /TAXON_ID=36898 /ORGANISM="Pyramimonas sp., Strain CCMP2087" /LENGTH=54 /DNA_ID=CAMNT_0043889823 /DNA_START=84 /DNA_END=248 /DNA_ORIENTATION=-